MTKNLDLRVYLEPGEIVVDSFAGGGGASSGLSEIEPTETLMDLITGVWKHSAAGPRLDMTPDIAINHDPEAIAMHKANHPTTEHYTDDIWHVDPAKAVRGRKVGLMWLSPTCTFFSKAKGTALSPEAVKIRALCWSGVRWAAAVRPRIICLENVEEFEKYGPVHRHHDPFCKGVACKKDCVHGTKRRRGAGGIKEHSKGCKGRGCHTKCRIHQPIKSRQGETFRAWVRRLEKLGYKVEWRVLRACDYGAPTTRRRLFLVARCDGRPIVWPEATHGPGKDLAHRPASDVIDWGIPCPSIFERDRPLADKTLARIARGIKKFVLESAKPFIVPTAYGSKGANDDRTRDIDQSFPTVCGARGGHAIVVPYMVHRSNGERPEKVDKDGRVVKGQAPRIYDITKPIGTMMAQGIKHGLSVALLIKNNGGNNDRAGCSGQAVDRAMDTVSCRDTKAVTVAHMVKLRGTSDAHVNASASSMNDSIPCVTASGTHIGAVSALLVRYNGQSEEHGLDKPIGTLDCKDRYGLVTVQIDGEDYMLVDIGFRMLEPHELFAAQGFRKDYVIDLPYNGKPLTKTAKIRMCGNSVPPVMAKVLARAQLEAR